MTTSGAAPQLLAPREVAALFRVDPKTVTRWAEQGRLTTVRTLGGHRRFRADEVYALLRGSMTSGSGLAKDPGEGYSA
jgi:excisionase family DNA binding protein